MAKAKRNKKEIKRWMLDNDITVTSIQEELGYETHSVISNTLASRAHNRKVLRWFKEQGCPVKYLALPKDMNAKAA